MAKWGLVTTKFLVMIMNIGSTRLNKKLPKYYNRIWIVAQYQTISSSNFYMLCLQAVEP